MPADLAALKASIVLDLHRSDLTTPIASAITQAINKYRSRRFEFNEKQASFNTVASQESFTSGDTGFPTDIGAIDMIRMTFNGVRTVIHPIPFAELQAKSTTTTLTGQPYEWAWYTQKLFFYPIPDAVYATQVSYQQRKAAPSADNDSTTIWTNECEPLIRACAKRLVARDYMQDEALMARCADAEREALNVLLNESSELQDEGALSPND